jgi:hypothetical protein
MVIGTDGKWSEALKAAFIQASPAGRVKMPPPPAFRALNRQAAAAVSEGVAAGRPGQPAATVQQVTICSRQSSYPATKSNKRAGTI